MTDRPLRIGLLGASKIAPMAVVEPAVARADVVLAAVAARDPARAEAFAGAHGVAAVAADYAELVARDDVDLVYNALPPSEHPRWSIEALEAGKAVLCEKPLTLTAAEAKTMADAAARTGGLLMEAFHYRHHRVMHHAVALVRSGRLGRLVRAEGAFTVTIRRSPGELRWIRALGGGALMDLGVYPLHALRTLFGSEPTVRAAHGRFEPDGVDAELEAELDFDGATARIACSLDSQRRHAALRLEGEAGVLEIVNFIAPQFGCRFTVNGVEQPVDGPSTYGAQMEHLVQVWRGKAAPVLTPADAVANMDAIDAIYAAAGRPG